MELTELERMALAGLQARDREVAAAADALQREYRRFLALVEERLGLPAGAVGTTHALDPAAGTVHAEPSASGAGGEPGGGPG